MGTDTVYRVGSALFPLQVHPWELATLLDLSLVSTWKLNSNRRLGVGGEASHLLCCGSGVAGIARDYSSNLLHPPQWC